MPRRIDESQPIDNRLRLLALLDILTRKTDEDTKLSLSEFQAELVQRFGLDHRVTRDSIQRDLETFQAAGWHISSVSKRGYPTLYGLEQRTFDLYELRVLIDAVASSRFLTAEDSKHLIDKLRSLTSDNQAKKLVNNLFVDHPKTTNPAVKLYIGQLHEAISERFRISFQYRKYNLQRQFQLHRDGFLYHANPYALVWNNDYYYYLIAKQDGMETLKTFRVDRLYNISFLPETFPMPDFNVSKYVDQTFNMYPGEVNTVRVQFNNGLLNVVMDRFGQGGSMFVQDAGSFIVVTQAAISEGLVRWLLTWGSDAKVLSPASLVERMKIEIDRMTQRYNEG